MKITNNKMIPLKLINASFITQYNCNFTNNTASEDGGAVYFWSNGEVRNCNFTGNKANYGGVVYFNSKGTVSNCNFTNKIVILLITKQQAIIVMVVQFTSGVMVK